MMKITWLSQGSFLFEAQGKRILIDPYMSNCLDDKGISLKGRIIVKRRKKDGRLKALSF